MFCPLFRAWVVFGGFVALRGSGVSASPPMPFLAGRRLQSSWKALGRPRRGPEGPSRPLGPRRLKSPCNLVFGAPEKPLRGA